MTLNDTAVRFGRQVLRGFSQCAFQSNEIAGSLFVLAVAVFNWRMAIAYVLAVILGTLTARSLKGNEALLDEGLYGFNSGLIGLALSNFFVPSLLIWLWIAIFAVVAAVATVAMAKWLRFPFLAAPFILTFWALWPIADGVGLSKIDLGTFPAVPVMWGTAIFSALGSALFCPSIVSGALFLAGLATSNWRHALVAVLGDLIAVALGQHAGASGAAINSGFVGFNAVLAALAAYVVIEADLRLVALGAILATWLASYVHRAAFVPVLASGFVIAIWGILLLGRINSRFNAVQTEPKVEPNNPGGQKLDAIFIS